MSRLVLNQQRFNIDELFQFILSNGQVELGEEARESIQKCRSYLDNKMENFEGNIYGINTGVIKGFVYIQR